MQLADHFDVLLKDTVNLSQFKLETLETRVDAIYAAIAADATIGAMILGKTPQGSWAHRTIIQPQKGKEFDADFMLDMEENPDWSTSPKTYIDEVYYALKRHPKYGQMPLGRVDQEGAGWPAAASCAGEWACEDPGAAYRGLPELAGGGRSSTAGARLDRTGRCSGGVRVDPHRG